MSATFFGRVKRRQTAVSLVKKFVRDLESGLFAAPNSYDAFSRYRTEQLKLNRRNDLLQVTYPENPLLQGFHAKYPQAKAVPIQLNSFTPPVAKVFALRQLRIMQEAKVDAAAAFARAEQELQPQLQALTTQALGTNVPPLRLVQQEEEQRLRDAAAALAEGKLPVEP